MNSDGLVWVWNILFVTKNKQNKSLKFNVFGLNFEPNTIDVLDPFAYILLQIEYRFTKTN